MSSERDISIRQQNILSALNENESLRKTGLSVRELGDASDTTSTSVVEYNIDHMAEMGLVETEPSIARSTSITEKGKQYITPAVREGLVVEG
ncbi:hypothetical protein A2803_05940 [Candidatus Woesebacteria bacterium RIFCSPHIGHO2_01_FULL_44_21]|uniref:HTH marR-type domain-containing protein n=1 Tax=Candidatus Woesebacteria bacterium RIFCSPHIGHO2_01_FULL_44_21 TaxID=1802503 RepID=A0A1F7YZY1_9BACT|nr:MAG: hypothetical protein A2803_05940 [Candidatus Woesebacteria bacterium RIFCSPHIGHO2_01_FULL_44_21]OGM71078.1 MAG: hypothetical protein A2897_02485 [Candidatus Woesebacteria bacterium RIFCSPLOWO2_01_FULL_44_24b]